MRRHHLRRINRGGDPIATWQLLFPRLETASLRMINDKVEGREVKLAGCPGIRHRNAIAAVGLASAILCAEISDASGVKLLTSIPKKEWLKIHLALTATARDLKRVSKWIYEICPNVECTIVWNLLAILNKISLHIYKILSRTSHSNRIFHPLFQSTELCWRYVFMIQCITPYLIFVISRYDPYVIRHSVTQFPYL